MPSGYGFFGLLDIREHDLIKPLESFHCILELCMHLVSAKMNEALMHFRIQASPNIFEQQTQS